LQGQTDVCVQEGHIGAGHNRARLVLNDTGDRSFIDLAEGALRREQQEAQAC
jgi:hypothetical protein